VSKESGSLIPGTLINIHHPVYRNMNNGISCNLQLLQPQKSVFFDAEVSNELGMDEKTDYFIRLNSNL
jgi:hypothetical protein